MKRVAVSRRRRPDQRYCGGITRCLDGCGKFPNGATRERCRQHVRQTGHRVEYVVEDVTTYGPGGAS